MNLRPSPPSEPAPSEINLASPQGSQSAVTEAAPTPSGWNEGHGSLEVKPDDFTYSPELSPEVAEDERQAWERLREAQPAVSKPQPETRSEPPRSELPVTAVTTNEPAAPAPAPVLTQPAVGPRVGFVPLGGSSQPPEPPALETTWSESEPAPRRLPISLGWIIFLSLLIGGFAGYGAIKSRILGEQLKTNLEALETRVQTEVREITHTVTEVKETVTTLESTVPIPGPAGEAGEAGATGLQGPSGATGPAGVSGDPCSACVFLQGNTPGSAQTGNFNISGTGILGSLQTGTALFKNAADSVTAFQIQNQASQSIFTADTANSKVTVTGNLYQSPVSPVYLGGADASGSTNSGTDNVTFNSVAVSGSLAVVAPNGSATACSGTPGSAIGCEVKVFDVSNPASAKYLGGADISGTTNSGTTNGSFSAVAVSGRYAYLGNSSNITDDCATIPRGCELQIYDLSNPSSPTYAGGADAPNPGGTSTAITVSGRYAYVTKNGFFDTVACSSDPVGCELRIYDVSNPAKATYVGGADSGSSGVNTGGFDSVTISGRYAYVTTLGRSEDCATNRIGCEFQIYDISNPSSPTYVGGADASGSANSGTTSNQLNSVTVAGRYAYVTKQNNATACSQSAGSAVGCELQVYDISNPAIPTYLGGADGSGLTNSGTASSSATFISASVSGRYLYVAKGGSTTACSQVAGSAIGCELQVYDVSNPAAPAYASGADASGLPGGVEGSQFNRAVVSGRYAFVAKQNNSTACSSAVGCELQAYDISGVEAVSVRAGSLEAGNISVRESAQFAADVAVTGSLSVGQNLHVAGGLGIAGAITGEVLFKNSADSAIALRIQNSTGANLLVADTSSLKVSTTQLDANGTISSTSSGAAARLSWDLGASAPLTVSGNEITDQKRSANTQGDGQQAPDSSTGIWEGTTNLVTNGGVETNTTGWAAAGSATLSRVTTQQKFGSAALRVVTSGAGPLEGMEHTFAMTPGNTYTASIWIRADSPTSLRLIINTSLGNNGGTGMVPVTTTWQRLTTTATVGIGASFAGIHVDTGSTPTATTFYVDGAQVEEQPIATPYVETNGGTATRNDARVQASATGLDETQMWVAARVRMGFAATDAPHGVTELFSWSDGASQNRLELEYDTAIDRWVVNRQSTAGGISNGARSPVQTFARGDVLTIVAKWTATQEGVSINGSAFTTVTMATVPPTLASATFDIGRRSWETDKWLDSDVLWFAAGTGTLSDGSAATLHAYGNSDPLLSDLTTLSPGTTTPAMVWDGKTSAYSSTGGTSQSMLQLDDASIIRSAASTLKTQANAVFQPATDSTNVFNILKADGVTSLLTVDSTNMTITLGAPSATPVLLVLGNKNTSGDPTCTPGAIYYNSSQANGKQAKVCIGGSWAALGVPTVTTLPTTPSDGDEVYYQADATNGIVWHLRYNAGSASTYKWEYLGGQETRAFAAGGTLGSASTSVKMANGITIPRAGEYNVTFGGQLMCAAFNGEEQMSLTIRNNDAAITAVTGSGKVSANINTVCGTGNNRGNDIGAKFVYAAAANDILSWWGFGLNSGSFVQSLWMRATPVRVN